MQKTNESMHLNVYLKVRKHLKGSFLNFWENQRDYDFYKMNFKNKETSDDERKQTKLSKAFDEKREMISKFNPILATSMSRINILKKLGLEWRKWQTM